MRLRLLAALVFATPALALADSRCPDVLVVLDASSSMSNNPGGGVTQSKISIARSVIHDVLLGNADAGLPPADSRIRFGYTYFPPTTNCGAGPTTPLPVPCGYETESTIVSTVQAQALHGSTPTAETLEAVKATADMTDATRPRYVIVVTDGMPTCGNDAGGRAVGAVGDLSAEGVTTFVVGFGSEAATAQVTLSGMAAAGQPHLPDGGGAAYYQANDATSLASALSDILGQAGGELGGSSCDPCLDASCTSAQRCELDGGQPSCVPDPCHAANCPSGQFCRPNGTNFSCVAACTSGCPSGQACVDGSCVTDGCSRGTCRTCANGQVAEIDGGCGPNGCAGVECPSDAPVCLYGSCSGFMVIDAGATGSAGGSGGSAGASGGTSGNHAVTSSGCGCSAGDAAGLGAFALFGLALLLRPRGARR